MASTDNKSKDHDNNDTTATFQEQIFLEALQGFILPLIGSETDTNRQKEMAQNLTGPQAMKFIAALKKFISSIMGGSATTEVQTIVEVDLNEVSVDGSESTADDTVNDLEENDDSSESIEDDVDDSEENDGTLASPRLSSQHDRSDSGDESLELDLLVPKPTFHEKLLRELHHRVFNRMPIRLLRFVQNGPTLEISLIERSAIYEHLVSVLLAKQNDAEYKPWVLMNSGDTNVYFWDNRLVTEDEVVSRLLEEHSGYAILSHTWLREAPEVTYGDWKAKSFDAQGPGYRKLVNFCKVAYTMHGLTLGWMDTVCINKESSSELDESIRSMYKWYERSKICVVHLADTGLLGEMHKDSWFTRGWTLQELLAPSVLKFYDQSWMQLVSSDNDKNDGLITDKVKQATSVSTPELNDIRAQSISRKMQLAAPRKVTREEDTAYSLMGLFDVSLATAYGEGAEHAFFRLLQEILNSKSKGVLDLFNWAGRDYSSVSKVLPRSPQQYLARSSSSNLRSHMPIGPLTLTHMGVRIPVLLMPGISIQEDDPPFKLCGDNSALISISPIDRRLPTTYRLLPEKASARDSVVFGPTSVKHQFTFAVYNITKEGENIIIPAKCIAIVLACIEDTSKVSSTGQFSRIYTKEPVVFDMLKRNPNQRNSSAKDYMVKVNKYHGIRMPPRDLEKHGMQLVSKYL